MKKILGIIVLSLLLSGNVYSSEEAYYRCAMHSVEKSKYPLINKNMFAFFDLKINEEKSEVTINAFVDTANNSQYKIGKVKTQNFDSVDFKDGLEIKLKKKKKKSPFAFQYFLLRYKNKEKFDRNSSPYLTGTAWYKKDDFKFYGECLWVSKRKYLTNIKK